MGWQLSSENVIERKHVVYMILAEPEKITCQNHKTEV